MDTSTLFTNVRILDGTGAMPYSGSVLVQGNRIRTVGRSTAALSPTGATVIDGAGATLMPGMCEAHTHFSWNDAATLSAIQRMPLEEHVLWCAKVARRYLSLDQGMVMAALGNALANDDMRKYVSKGAMEQNLRPLMEMEHFSAKENGQ